MTVHASAREGYANVGTVYEKGRPEYPPDAVAYLLQRLGVARSGTDKTVIDLAAGTGKFSRALLAAGVTPTAVEPVEHMRATLKANTPGITALDGTAESMPLADAASDAVVVAQAFHWFDGPRALQVIHRVLKPMGGLGLVWNGQDRTIDWVEAIWAEVDARRDDTPSAWSYAWKDAFTPDAGFSPLLTTTFRHDHQTDRDGLVARVVSISFVARGPQSERDVLEAHIHKVCDDAGLPERFALPYNCFVHWCRRV
ncbi:MAG: class I SAM-dependent methyltransferase [Acidimicrobiales bacterium]|nr:class I SAM-dependent methyltransferase [Acidimicrobiales bacterium]